MYLSFTPKCDCGNSHKLNGVFYDAAVPTYRQWAGLCQDCFTRHGCKTGTGFGQKYIKQENGKWLKVAG